MRLPDFSSLLLGKTIVPYTWLLNAALAFTGVVITILVYIFFFLHRNRKRRQQKKSLCLLFSDLIAETAICEMTQEIEDILQQFSATNKNLLQQPAARHLLIRELVKTEDSISGQSAENLRILFEKLALDQDCFAHFSSGKWHRKASAIQQLAEMRQNKYLVKIYRETNSRNRFVRAEAQIAVVKLTGFKGLRFLNIVSHPISQWQQLSLISQLQDSDVEEEKIKPWLSSKNETVTEFALRLVEIYTCFDLYDDVIRCLQHTSLTVRLQALEALKVIGNDNTPAALMEHFPAATKQEQLQIVDLLSEANTGSDVVGFLTSLLEHREEAVRFRAMRAIGQLSPVWSSILIKNVQGNPSFTYILSTLEKQAV